MEQQGNTETVQVTMKKSSLWTFVKYIVAGAFITVLGNVIAYSIVGSNHLLAKLVGLFPEAVIQFCSNCLEALE